MIGAKLIQVKLMIAGNWQEVSDLVSLVVIGVSLLEVKVVIGGD